MISLDTINSIISNGEDVEKLLAHYAIRNGVGALRLSIHEPCALVMSYNAGGHCTDTVAADAVRLSCDLSGGPTSEYLTALGLEITTE